MFGRILCSDALKSAAWAGAALLLAACSGAAQRRPAWLAGGAFAGGMDGVGFSAYRAGEAGGVKKARDAAYNDAMEKLALKLRVVVRGEVSTKLRARSQGGLEVAEETVESLTGSVFDAVLGRKHFDEYRDDVRGEYWVRCWMSQEDADAAVRDALAEKERERALKTVSVRFSGGEAGLLALAETEFKRLFAERGFWVLARAQSGEARVAVSGELRTEDLGPARPLGVDLGRACRAALRSEALVAAGRGAAEGNIVAGRTPRDATGIGRTAAEACAKAAQRAAGEAAEDLVGRVSGAIAD